MRRLNLDGRKRRKRRTNGELAIFQSDILAIIRKTKPKSPRGYWYKAVGTGLIPKDDRFLSDIDNLLVDWRWDGMVPWDWVRDETRGEDLPSSWNSIPDFVETIRRSYRRSAWDTQSNYIQVWCEKNALYSTVSAITRKYQVPLYIGVGYSSHTLLHDAAMEVIQQGKPTSILMLGDWDPAGLDITRFIEATIRRHLDGAPFDIRFERLALNLDQIDRLGLITRPTKTGDKKLASFIAAGGTDSCELDAIDDDLVQEMLKDAIVAQIDPVAWNVFEAEQARDKAELQAFLDTYPRFHERWTEKKGGRS